MNYSTRFWTKNYQVGQYPLKKTCSPYPIQSLYSFLQAAAENFPKKKAFVCAKQELTYQQLNRAVLAVSNTYINLGLKKGDIILTLLPSGIEYLIADYACLRIGGIHIPLSHLTKYIELKQILTEVPIKTVIMHYKTLRILEKANDFHNIKFFILSNPNMINIIDNDKQGNPQEKQQDKLQEKTYYIYYSRLHKILRTHNSNAQILLFQEFYQKILQDPHQPSSDPLSSINLGLNPLDPKQDLALLLRSGGTTGTPKIAMITHYNLTSNILKTLHWIFAPFKQEIVGKTSALICLPLYHLFGYFAFHACVSLGLTTYLVNPQKPQDIAQIIKRKNPRMVFAVPTQYLQLCSYKLPKNQNTFYFSGAAPLLPTIQKKFTIKIGTPLINGMGATETTGSFTLNLSEISKLFKHDHPVKYGIGLPQPDINLKLVDPYTEKTVPIGERGEIWVKSDQNMLGYWPTPGLGVHHGNWISTGDIAIMDDDGYMQIVDRIKDMINISGHKVYSKELETLLELHPGIACAAVIGIPDPNRPGSERIKAFIQRNTKNSPEITSDSLKDFLRPKIQPYAIPSVFEFRTNLPRTALLKLNKKKLLEEKSKKS